MSKTNNTKWVQLKNGNLIMFLHHHLPFLQATTKVEWNALKDFFRLLDYVITQNDTYNVIKFRMSRKKLAKYGTGKYFNRYLEYFFIDERFWYTYSKSSKSYYTLDYLGKFIINCQKYLINKMGIDAYLTPLKIDFDTIVEKKAYNVTFNNSNFLDNDYVEFEKIYIQSNRYTQFIRDAHPIITDKSYFDKILTSNLRIIKQADLISFYKFTDREARKKEQEETIYTFNTKKDVFNFTLHTLSTLKDKIYTRITLDANEVNLILDEAIKENSLELVLLYNIKKYYVENINYIVYKEVRKRLYGMSESNIIDFQGLSKDVRQKLFKGLWQYDLEAAAPTILTQIYKKFYPNAEVDKLEAYTKNRNILRTKCTSYLVKTFNISYKKTLKDVKELITSLFYGVNIYNTRSSLALSYEKRVSLVDNVPEFKDFYNQVQQLFKNLYEYLIINFKKDENTIDYNGYIILLTEFSPKKGKIVEKRKASVISDIYYYHEKEILDIVYRNYKKDLTLLLHDGFIISKEIDIKQLEKDILRELNLNVKYEKEEL